LCRPRSVIQQAQRNVYPFPLDFRSDVRAWAASALLLSSFPPVVFCSFLRETFCMSADFLCIGFFFPAPCHISVLIRTSTTSLLTSGFVGRPLLVPCSSVCSFCSIKSLSARERESLVTWTGSVLLASPLSTSSSFDDHCLHLPRRIAAHKYLVSSRLFLVSPTLCRPIFKHEVLLFTIILLITLR